VDPDSKRLPPRRRGRSGARAGRAGDGLQVSVSDGRGRSLRDGDLARWLAGAVPAHWRGEVGIALVADARIRTLNHQYRRKNTPTDVLSFPADDAEAANPEPRAANRASRAASRKPRTASGGSRIADPASRMPHPRSRIPDPGSRNPDPGSRIPDPGSRIPHPGSRIPHPGSRQGTYLGDVVIATGVARRQAREAGHSYATELRVLALHGLLHLLGYDHDSAADRGRMARVETRLRRSSGLSAGLIERSRATARTRVPAGRTRRRKVRR
jgi:rRNA maturation RNase YbeY